MYSVEIRHDGLKKYRVITGREEYIVRAKARAQSEAWDDVWRRRTMRETAHAAIWDSKVLATALSANASDEIMRHENILSWSLIQQTLIDWNHLRQEKKFDEPQPPKPHLATSPREPKISDPEFKFELGLLDKLFRRRRRRIEENIQKQFIIYQTQWKQLCHEIRRQNEAATEKYELSLTQWEIRRQQFLAAQDSANSDLDKFRASFERGDEQSVIEYFELILSKSQYPQGFPSEFVVQFSPETGVVVLEFRLPILSDIPTIKEYKFVSSKNKMEEIYLSEKFRTTLYDSTIYQICLRTINEIFVNDYLSFAKSITFNGWVKYTNNSNGQMTTAYIVSINAKREEIEKINMSSIDPKACFRALKGVGSSRLHAMAAIQPLMQLNKDDKRFVQNQEVVSNIDSETNLASIGWEEFEHLIREIFEREFSSNGGEVKVTQASRDGGVDAVAFDPDPIRGGKIVIQAKRYTNTVDVSSVRDLYGTVLNEGAIKGILVTTSDFGPDAYQFAKDKPLTLMNGSNLLFLLGRHGHKARINLKEAKLLGTSMQRQSQHP